MRTLFLLAALSFPLPAFAASPTPPAPPVAPSAPSIAFDKAQKATAPIRLRDPLMLDDRRHQLTPPGRLPGSNKPMPKNGGGPEIG
ncbi:MAG: hypothetical protein V4601_05000 [Pseudomonadota bacterium]